MLLSYILCLVRNKDQIPFHAVVLARGMLQPGGNIVPLFVYATEINGGKGEKVSQVSGFELGRFAQQALTCSWKCLLKNSWIRSQGAGGMKGMNATEGLSPLWVLLCLSQPSLPRSLHMCKKPTCSEQECVSKDPGGCRSLRRSLLDPDLGTVCSPCKHRSAWPIWLLHLQDMAAGIIICAKNKSLVIVEIAAFQLPSSQDLTVKFGMYLVFQGHGRKETNRGQTNIRMGKASWPGIIRRGFIPFLGCVFTTDAPSKKKNATVTLSAG